VGNSEGEHTKGELEHQEVEGALDFLRAWREVDGGTIGLVGYSFGTSVILRSSAVQKRPKVFAFISPPLHALENSTLKKDKRPKLIISGDRDKLIQSEELPPVLESFSNQPDLRIVEGADHFWVGRENQLVRQVSEFFTENLK
jgi:alpha/beta superfamily hydrolase